MTQPQLPDTQPAAEPAPSRAPRPARWLGRRLRGLRRQTGWLVFLTIIGPGLVTANAGNDAGGIATYSAAGASYGYSLLWLMLVIFFCLCIVQEMCARMGAVTGKGLSDLIRENFSLRWTAFAMLALFISNTAIVISEFVGIAAASDLLGVSRYITVPLVAFGTWLLIIRGSYKWAERIFLIMSLVFVAYPISAFLAGPDWGAVLRGTVIPSVQLDSGYILLFVALVGTSISPYMQIYVQSAVVDKGVTTRDYELERIDVYFGSFFGQLIAGFIIIATAATLFVKGIPVETAADAAQALTPLAGPLAGALFAVGLFGASTLAAGVLPLATAYSICEAFGFENGVSFSFREAPVFHSLFTGLLIVGAAVALIPGVPIIQVLIVSQVVNNLVLPVILLSVMRLVNDRNLMGQYVNGPIANILAWGTTVSVIGLSLVLLGSTILGWFGINLGS